MNLSSKDLRLTLSGEKGTIELQSLAFNNTSLRSHINAVFQANGKTIFLNKQPFTILIEENVKTLQTKVGTLNAASTIIQFDGSGIELILRVGLHSSEPLAFIQLQLRNNSNKTLKIKRLETVNIETGHLYLDNADRPNPAFFSNGWQSWSHTGAYGIGEKQKQSILGRFQNPMVVNPGTPQPDKRNQFTGDMFGVVGDRNSRVGLLAGYLSQKAHFGSLEAFMVPETSLKMWANGDNALLPPGEAVQTDWAVLSFVNLDEPEPLGTYYNLVAKENDIDADAPVPIGWCSWYHFYQDITQENLLKNLESMVSLKPVLPLNLFQIDDGYETFPGDWFDFKPGFPKGFSQLIEKAADSGLTPGIWLAPFIVHPKSTLAKEHPEWLLRNKKGRRVNAGFVWNRFNYTLDLTNPKALNYCCDVIRTAVKTWGFTYLKLDFLYAAALDGVYQDRTQTRAQVLRKGLKALREAAGPDVTLLACGCPLGSALGLADAMRISADVSGHWDPHFPPVSRFLKKEPHMPAARNALQNILTRAPLHRYWWVNDPDCLLIREDTNLTVAEVQTLATAIGLSGGSLLLSDDLPALSKERLQIAQALLPALNQRPIIVDWFDSHSPARVRVDLHGAAGTWHLLAHFNWDDHPASLSFSPQDFNLPNEEIWWLREFWRGLTGKMGAASPFTFHDVAPHGVRVIAVRPYHSEVPAYLGSDLHLSQGMEISHWQVDADKLLLQFDLGRKANGSINLYLPKPPVGAWFKGEPHMMNDQGGNTYSIHLADVDGQTLEIKY